MNEQSKNTSKTKSFAVEAEILFKTTPVILYLTKQDAKKYKDASWKEVLSYLHPEYFDKMFKVAIQVYNALLGEALMRFNKLRKDPEYQKVRSDYTQILNIISSCEKKIAKLDKALAKERKLKSPDKKTRSARKKKYKKERSEICELLNKAKVTKKTLGEKIGEFRLYYGYTEYALHYYAAEIKHHFKDNGDKGDKIGINECQKLASRAFNAVEKYRKGQAKKVRFKRWYEDMSIEGKTSRSMISYKDGFIVMHKQYFAVDIKDAYIKTNLETRRIKYVRLIRRTVHGKHKYYAQFVMEGVPCKLPEYGKKSVGLDLGVSTVAVSSKDKVGLYQLGKNIDNIYKEICLIDRAMDRSKRATNPQNYDEDGVTKKGRLKWNYSNRYKKLRARRKELYRYLAARRIEENNRLANMIIAEGTDIYVEDMSILALAKRAKKTTYKKDGRINSKKRYGKTIMIRAPGQIINALERKLSYIDKTIIKVDPYKAKASQYDHKSDTYKKKPLSQRWHYFEDGTKVQRDMYSAFLLCNEMNRNKCKRNYKKFKQLHDEAVENIESALSWYVH